MVDDEQDIIAVIKTGLENDGYQVDTFNDPAKAIAQFKPNYYSQIILDVRMPNINGFSLAKLIWEKDDKARICFLSAFEFTRPKQERSLEISRHTALSKSQ